MKAQGKQWKKDQRGMIAVIMENSFQVVHSFPKCDIDYLLDEGLIYEESLSALFGRNLGGDIIEVRKALNRVDQVPVTGAW